MSEEASEPRKPWLRENFEAIVVAVLFALFVRTFIAQPYKIPSGSMEDNLLVGDHLVVNKVLHGDGADKEGLPFLPTRPIRRGDVVIFRPPHQEETDYIKRVIGLPGEELHIVFDPFRNGARVVVDGKQLPENFRLEHLGPATAEDGAKWTVTNAGAPAELRSGTISSTYRLGPDEYFMMGDNRNDSQDSRFWGSIHAVKAERIRGHALLVYWSYDVGASDPEPKGLGRRIGHYAHIALTFFTRSRWERTFSLIR